MVDSFLTKQHKTYIIKARKFYLSTNHGWRKTNKRDYRSKRAPKRTFGMNKRRVMIAQRRYCRLNKRFFWQKQNRTVFWK